MGVNNMYQLALAEDYFQNKLRKKVYDKGSKYSKSTISIFFF